ncbi:hypothetical protein D3C85_1328160 [compost metagenome]
MVIILAKVTAKKATMLILDMTLWLLLRRLKSRQIHYATIPKQSGLIFMAQLTLKEKMIIFIPKTALIIP